MCLLETMTGEEFFIYIVCALVSLLILGGVIATAVQVNRRNRLQRLTIRVLLRIAEMQGLPKEEIMTILEESKK